MQTARFFSLGVLLWITAACAPQPRTLVETSNPSPIAEPYPPLSGSFSGQPVPQSPDPLVACRWENPQASDDLEIYALYPETVTCDNQQASWNPHDPLPIRVTGPCDLRFDFGRVSPGWLEFDSKDLSGEIEMSISEYNEPAIFNAGSQHPRKTAVPVRYGDTYRLELNHELYEGVRFGWIHIHALDSAATIEQVRLVCQTKPVNYDGSFACDDDTLTRIWYTGAYTVRTNLLHDYFGAILMERSDRHAWTGDSHPSQAASMVAFGNFDFVRTNLLFTSTQSQYIPAYSLYWVLSLTDYYQYTDDRATVESLLENACHKLDSAYAIYDKDLDLRFYGWDERLGAGFENASCPESQRAYRMLAIRTWRSFASAMRAYGRNDLAEKYKRYADQKATAFMAGPEFGAMGVHAAAEAVNAGVGCDTPEQRERLWRQAFADRLQRVSYSPFNQFFILQAMAALGRYEEALTTLDDCWGGQLRYGATTFFEVFRPSWNDALGPNDAPVNNQCGYTSFTHPWSAGVTKWLSEQILGIRPLSPGFTSFEIMPVPAGGLKQISGSVPTPHGIVRASFDLNTGNASLGIPEGTTARLGIPKAGREIESVTFNGRSAETQGEDSAYLYYEGLQAGDYTLKIVYGQTAPQTAQTEPLRYRLRGPVTEDSLSGGGWVGKYGKQGYLLCHYDGAKRHRSRLPDFVESIGWNLDEPQIWETATEERRALSSNRPGEPRKAAAAITLDPYPCRQTLTMDIRCREENRPYTLALYFLDWERDGRRSAIEVFDLGSKELLMPVHVVKDYREGRYVVLPLEGSVRIRIDQVRGENAALSGIFFD